MLPADARCGILGSVTSPSKRSRIRARSVTALVILAAITVLAWASMTDLGRRPLDPTRLTLPGGYTLDLSRDADDLLEDLPHTSLTQALAALPVREGPGAGGYKRDFFGVRWADEDHNGCDTRNDVLARDLDDVTYKPGTHNCIVLTGSFVDPYTGRHLDFRRGNDTSSKVQIDHVVALADAWRSGADSWDEASRQRFANDPLNLLAVDGATNEGKGADAADAWLPENEGYRCAYVARQVAVKTRWGLSVSAAEHRALVAVAATCPDEPLPAQ